MSLDATSALIGLFSGSVIAGTVAFVLRRGALNAHRKDIEIVRREAELRVRELRATDEADLRAQRSKLAEEITDGEKLRGDADALGKKNATEAMSLARDRANHAQEARRLASLTREEARKIAIDSAKLECEAEISRMRDEMIGRREEELRNESRRILIDTMQRLSSAVVHEVNATLVPIPDENMKGRLIGREGRNIKAFETLTGTTLMIDETPDSVLVSSFDPVRREIARVALAGLVRDGRIHPASIESFVEAAREEVLATAQNFGRQATEDAQVGALGGEALELLGRLRFRLSMNQNTLEHSVETAHLAAMIAAELGLDPAPARRAGLLHDIGKAMNDETSLGHAGAGATLLRRLGDDTRVVNAVAAHHCEVEDETVYAPILRLADGISASRPGARSSTLEGYIERVRGLETLAKEFPGVSEAHAIQAGREVRVIVSPTLVSEEDTKALARKIRVRIEEEMQYPGTVRVVLIREQRFTEEAR